MTRYRMYTGPGCAKAVAQWVKNAGFTLVVAGTEHVIFSAEPALDRYDTLILLQDSFQDQGLRWVVRARDLTVISGN